MFVSSVIGLIAAFFVDSHRKLSGAIMTASGSIGILLAVVGEPSGNLILLIAGIITLLRKPQPPQPDQSSSQPQKAFCASCGNPLPENKTKFCTNCGVGRDAPVEDTGTKLCRICSNPLPKPAQFCDQCGAQQ
jgi:membrane protease subunit (stomatin/prohibitin family)